MKIIFAAALLILGISFSAHAQTKLKATVNVRSVSVSWTGSITPGVNYHVYRSALAAGPFTLMGSPATPSYTDATTISGATYVYQVTSFCPATGCPAGISGESGPSPQVSVTIPITVFPAAPSAVTVTVIVVGSK